MNTTTKVTLIVVLFAVITFVELYFTGMLNGTMEYRWMMGK